LKIDENDYFAVIPARAGSKRIPNKHMQLIGEKTMIQFTIEAALESTELGSTIISSDASDIIKLAVEMGANAPFTRPHNLSTDNAMTTAVLKHALDWYKSHNDQYPNNIVLLQPTSPFRTANDIDQAIKLFRDSQKNRLISACELMQHPTDCLVQNDDGSYKRIEEGLNSSSISGRQTFRKTIYIDGSIYICSVSEFLETGDLIGLETGDLIGEDSEIMMLPQSHAIDIDTQFDLELARCIYKSGILI
jgi:CMP-N,N'-diacetyllegionaminic acid synthase